MARLRDALILDEISFLDEKLGGNPIFTLRNIFYLLGGGLLAYKLFDTYKIGLQLLGILIFLFVLALIVYPKKSQTLESIFVGMFAYLLGFNNENVVIQKERKPKQEKKKQPKEKKKASEAKQEGQSEEKKPEEKNEEKKMKEKKPMGVFDYAIIVLGLALGIVGIMLFRHSLYINYKELYMAIALIVAGFSLSLEKLIEIIILR